MAAAAAPAQATLAAEAWDLMAELMQRYGKARFMAAIAELELSPPQAMALRVLRPGHPVAMSALAGALGCDNSNVTGIVDRLEDRGLVERRSDPRDRRVKMLVVTARGGEARRRLADRLASAPEPLARLDEADQRALRDILRRALELAGDR